MSEVATFSLLLPPRKKQKHKNYHGSRGHDATDESKERRKKKEAATKILQGT